MISSCSILFTSVRNVFVFAQRPFLSMSVLFESNIKFYIVITMGMSHQYPKYCIFFRKTSLRSTRLNCILHDLCRDYLPTIFGSHNTSAKYHIHIGRKVVKQKQKQFWNMWTIWNNLKPSRNWNSKIIKRSKEDHPAPHFTRKQDCEELGGPNVEY